MSTKKEDSLSFEWNMSLAQGISLVLIGIYVSGFISMNAYLGKHGVFDFDFTNGRFLIAGGLFSVFLVCWYMLAGRHMIFGVRSFREDIEHLESCGYSSKWSILTFVRSGFFDSIHTTCLSVAFFSIIVLGSLESAIFLFYTTTLFFAWFVWLTSRYYTQFPRLSEIFKCVIALSGSIVFFVSVDYGSLEFLLFFHFLGISMYVNLMLDIFNKFRITRDMVVYNVASAILFVIINSSMFGFLYYENIRSDFGGGRGRSVEIIIGDHDIHKGLRDMDFQVDPFLKANIIHEGHQEIIIEIEEDILRLPKTAIKVLRVLPTEDHHPLFDIYILSDILLGSPVEEGSDAENSAITNMRTPPL